MHVGEAAAKVTLAKQRLRSTLEEVSQRLAARNAGAAIMGSPIRTASAPRSARSSPSPAAKDARGLLQGYTAAEMAQMKKEYLAGAGNSVVGGDDLTKSWTRESQLIGSGPRHDDGVGYQIGPRRDFWKDFGCVPAAATPATCARTDTRRGWVVSC